MTHSMKRGLGLLTVGLPLVLIAALLIWLMAPMSGPSALVPLTVGVFGVGCTLIGLGLMAAGLLRD